MMADFVVIGHIAIDRVITTMDDRTQIGGPPAYVALIAKKLGEAVDTVTKVGRDIPDSFLYQLQDFGVELGGMVVEGSATTRFTLDYRGTERRLSVSSICDEIKPEDIVEETDTVLISPIVGEVSPSTASIIDANIIALDPQGFVREVGRDGSVRPRHWFDGNLMRKLTVYKSSEEELKLITGEEDWYRGLEKITRLGADLAIATRGYKGALLLSRKRFYMLPSYEVVKPLDPTGAGDVFMGGFFSEYLKGEDALWCASIGASGASYVVETLGPNIRASRKQIERRAEEIHNQTVKL